MAWETWSTENGRTLVMHPGGTGGFSAIFALDRAAKHGVVLLSDTALTEVGGLRRLGMHLLDRSLPAGAPRTMATAEIKLIDALVGRYRLPFGLGMELRRRDNDESNGSPRPTVTAGTYREPSAHLSIPDQRPLSDRRQSSPESHYCGIRDQQLHSLMLSEKQHRSRNMFMIGALADSTLRAHPDPVSFKRILGRLAARARAHSLGREDANADLRALLGDILAPRGSAPRINLSGPSIFLAKDAAAPKSFPTTDAVVWASASTAAELPP